MPSEQQIGFGTEAAWASEWLDTYTACFSPSGNALAIQPRTITAYLRCLEVHFSDGREPVRWQQGSDSEEETGLVVPLAWASDDELIFYVAGQPVGPDEHTSVQCLSVSSGRTRIVLESEDTMSVSQGGETGHLSILMKPAGGKVALFDLDVAAARLRHLSGFDRALNGLEIYPLFGHAWYASRQEVVVIGWPEGEYLDPATEPTRHNSQWSPIFGAPKDEKHKTPSRAFLLGATGERIEVPNTYGANHPLWSADGSLLSVERFEHYDPQIPHASINGIWTARRDDLSVTRLGGCGYVEATLMHPGNLMFCHLEDEPVADSRDRERVSGSARWRTFQVRDGEAREMPGRQNAR